MEISLHLVYFAVAAAVIWFFSGLLVDAIDRVAKRRHQNGFTVAFFVLGLMTSISEISVMMNSTLNGTPQVSAGNLSGASIVILLFIVPLLAVMNRGMQLHHFLQRPVFALSLGVIILPALFLADGAVGIGEGIFATAAYILLLYFIRKAQTGTMTLIEEVEQELTQKTQTNLRDGIIIVAGALAIFLAGHTLVEESIYFSNLMHIPPSIIGLLILSIGTNVPEIVIAVRSIRKQHTDIAFGDYLGSAVANTLVFGFLSIFNGAFNVEATEFTWSLLFLLITLPALFLFSVSKSTLSRREGALLLVSYGLFVAIQVINIAMRVH